MEHQGLGARTWQTFGDYPTEVDTAVFIIRAAELPRAARGQVSVVSPLSAPVTASGSWRLQPLVHAHATLFSKVTYKGHPRSSTSPERRSQAGVNKVIRRGTSPLGQPEIVEPERQPEIERQCQRNSADSIACEQDALALGEGIVSWQAACTLALSLAARRCSSLRHKANGQRPGTQGRGNQYRRR